MSGFRSCSDNRINSHTSLHSHTHARLDHTDVSNCVRGFFALDHRPRVFQCTRTGQFGAINLDAKAMGHILKESSAKVFGLREVRTIERGGAVGPRPPPMAVP